MKKAILNKYELNGYTVHSNLPIGTVIPSFANTTPVGFLNCDHTKIKKSDYPELWDRLKDVPMCQSEETDYFFTPDLREVSLVGIGENGTLDISAHDIYDVGQFKDDQFQGHSHKIQYQDNANVGGGGNARALRNETPYNQNSGDLINDVISDGTNGTPRTGTTTHGKQVGVRWIIKATQYATVEQNAIDDTRFTTGNVLSAQKTKELAEEVYSDEEVIIGYLIQNGVKKPIYRKVWFGEYRTIDIRDLHIQYLMKTDASFIQGTNYFMCNSISDREILTNTEKTTLNITGSGTVQMVILEYTKTTD